MDEDDSQDELINRSSKGKRAAAWAISDDSDEAGSDEEVDSESGEEDEEEHLNEEDDEDEDEDEDEEDEDGEGKPDEEEEEEEEERACAGTSADAEVSSDEEAEKCPICLHSFSRQPVATPENCEHYFCLDCILEWSKNANSCPIDRTNFKVIYLRTCFGGKVQKMITIQKPAKKCEEETIDLNLEETSCEVCGGSDREDRLLLCDGCDAGYHMECLTPPLDAVPVEEWFCPECEANNRQSRSSAAETSDTDSLPSTARTASSRSRSHAGQTRAIARTQHSERVRANVNRHRITQARTQELAPTYLIRSTWLDETINAVVAGLNSAVYVRDLTPRPSATRRRKTRKTKSRKTSSKSKKGKAAGTRVKRRKRKVRRTKSRKKLVTKKIATPRSRIANSLGIVKDKKSSSLPTVYRPSESTLSSMRADIGAASLSIYGDPFDLDPFSDREDDEQQTHDSALLEAKRRGISRSAFRSHQPVARPVSLSRRPVSVPQASAVAEAAPVPDLLGSILSGQSMLLMDSSDVIINRDGSLKTTKPMSFTNPLRPSSSSRSSSSGDGGLQVSPGPLQNHVERLGSSDSSLDQHFSSSSPFSPTLGSAFSPSETSPSLVAPRGNPSLLGSLSLDPHRPNQRVGLQMTNGVSESRQNGLSSHLLSDSSKSKASSQSHSLKAPPKPMWMDVSGLPRIPKIKRESSSDDAASTTNGNTNKSNGSSSSSAHSHSMPDTVINRLAGDKERGHSVDQQHGRTAGPRSRPDGAGSSSGFSSSFSSSSSATASHTNHQRFSSGSSSSSSSVSFRISSSGNSWHSRRLNIASLTPSGSSFQENCTEEEKKRQLRRDKQKLLASRSKDTNNIYDPFNPTESDSGSSDGESGNINVECSSRVKQEPAKLKNKVFSKSRWDLKQVKVETHSQDKPVTTAAQETFTQQQQGTKVNAPFRKSRFSHIERPFPFNTGIKMEPESDEDEKHVFDSAAEDTSQTVHQRLEHIKTEKTVKEEPKAESPAASFDGNSLATSSLSPIRTSSSSPARKPASSPVRKSSSSPNRNLVSSPARKCVSSPVRKSSSSPSKKSASSPPRKSSTSPERKSASSLRKLISSPSRKSPSSPKKSASSPRKFSPSPVRKSASSPSRKSASTSSRKSPSSPTKSASSSPRNCASSPPRKSASSPLRKSASSPLGKSASSASRKSASSPSRKSASSPSRKSASSPSRKSASSPSRKSASSPSRKSASSPSRKSASSPLRKSASSPLRKSASSPLRKSASSPLRKSASSPLRKSASSPLRKSASSPLRKSASSPTRNSVSSPSRKSASSPSRKSASSPPRKSASSPPRKSTLSPIRKSASSPMRRSEKTETKSLSDSEKGGEKNASKRNVSSKEQRGRSSSTERPRKPSSPDHDRRQGHTESKLGGNQKEKDKAKSSRRSRSKERRRTHRDSDSSQSKSPERTSKKRRHSRSRSKDGRRSRSCSSSSSRERSRTKKHKKRSRERNEDKDLQRRSSKDKRRDRSRSRSRSKSRSRSRERRHVRSRSRSKERKRARSRSKSRSRERRHARSRSKSRSRSRERRRARSRSKSRSKERRHARSRSKSRSRTRSRSRERRKAESRRQPIRDEAESRSKDKKRRRSRSNSREKKKERLAVKVQKTTDNSNSSVKDKKNTKDKKIEDLSSAKAERASKTNKPSSSSADKTEPKESKVEEKPVETDVKSEKTKKEMKKEKCTALDMFEDSPTSTPVKKEELDIPVLDGEIKCEEDTQMIKTEVCEGEKLEFTSPEKKPSASDSPIFSIHPPSVSTPPQDSEEPITEVPTISIKQEPLPQSSDSDDDFNVDVMLDNLDLVKSRMEEATEATVKEEKSEGEAAAVGTKSKTQVKRVTWNIEEPVGPQPEKSASKVALYKLKLKQEGIRRPSAVSAASQDLSGTASAGDVTKPCIDPEPQALSALSQGQSDDGDVLKKDKTYLKKLHMQERAVEEVKLAIKPFYQKRDINKDEYKEILRKAVQKVCHSKSGEINPVKVGNLVKAYVDKYKHARKYKKGDEPGKSQDLLKPSDSP